MLEPKPALVPALTYLGGLPFALAAGLLCSAQWVSFSASSLSLTMELLSQYSALIAAFVAGSQWGRLASAMQQGQWAAIRRSMGLVLLYSNVVVLVLWVAVVVFSPEVSFVVAGMSFAGLLLSEWYLYRLGTVALAYLQMRSRITLAVIFCLLVAWLFAP